MEEKTARCRIGESVPVNVPVQMICGMDTTGSITPIRFRFQTAEDTIETVTVEQVISRDEKNYVGIREKQFICAAQIGGVRRILEMRYHVAGQKWRIFQFLS